jgi:hypothetical protein
MPPPDFSDQVGMRVGEFAMDPRTFIKQQVSPICFQTTAEAAPYPSLSAFNGSILAALRAGM